jgi:chromosome segregation ATPase
VLGSETVDTVAHSESDIPLDLPVNSSPGPVAPLQDTHENSHLEDDHSRENESQTIFCDAESQTNPSQDLVEVEDYRQELFRLREAHSQLSKQHQHNLVELTTLQEETTRRRDSLQQAGAIAVSLNTQLTDVKAKVEAVTHERNVLESEQGDLRVQISQLQSDLMASKSALSTAETQAKSDQLELKRWKSGCKSLITRYSVVEDERDALKSQVAKLEEDLRVAHCDIRIGANKLSQLEQAAQAEVSRWQSGFKSVLTQKTALEQEKNELQQRVSSLMEDMQSINSQHQQSQAAMEACRAELIRWKSNCKTVVIQRATLESDKAEQRTQIVSLKQELDQANEQLSQQKDRPDLAKALEESEAAVAQLEKKVDDQRSEINEVRSNVQKEVEVTKAQHHADSDTWANERQDLSQRLKKAETDLSSLQTSLEMTEGRLRIANLAVSDLEARHRTVVSEKSGIEKQKNDFMEQIRTWQGKAKLLSDQLRLAQDNVRSAEEELRHAEATARQAEQEKQRLEALLQQQRKDTEAGLSKVLESNMQTQSRLKEQLDAAKGHADSLCALEVALEKIGLVRCSDGDLMFSKEVQARLEELRNTTQKKVCNTYQIFPCTHMVSQGCYY